MSSPPMLMLLLISHLLCLSWFLSLLSAISVIISLHCIVLHVLRVCVFDSCLKILILILIVWLLDFFDFFAPACVVVPCTISNLTTTK
ncbi:uncharacterized protein BDV14DRAFT_153463 [Aspergillus stella-maris]|uniref:uncharacterized protein n=1 Tax=Aspergillus stella-maris TaxID=1810926 RepID=UPI003CCDF0CE